MSTNIDWDSIHNLAKDAMKKAYAPYSNFPVGVAALVNDGRLISGANVENASYGVGLCAECSLVSALTMSGGAVLLQSSVLMQMAISFHHVAAVAN